MLCIWSNWSCKQKYCADHQLKTTALYNSSCFEIALFYNNIKDSIFTSPEVPHPIRDSDWPARLMASQSFPDASLSLMVMCGPPVKSMRASDMFPASISAYEPHTLDKKEDNITSFEAESIWKSDEKSMAKDWSFKFFMNKWTETYLA